MSSCGCLALHSQVDDSPPWCSVTWMFFLLRPLALIDSYNTVFCSHRLRADRSVIFLRERVKPLELSGSQRSGFTESW